MRAHCQAIDIKEALVGRQPNVYLIIIIIVFSCFLRFMIMWSHKINIEIENGIKNSRRKNHTLEEGSAWRSTPEQSMVLALNARQMLLQGVIFLLLFLIPFSIFLFIL